jgi:methylenetetrahydrofolate reductase (NADPH)
MRHGWTVTVSVRHCIDTVLWRGEAKLDWLNPLQSDRGEREDTDAEKQAIVDLLIGFSVETLCRACRGDSSHGDLLPPGTRVHVGPKANPAMQDIVSAAQMYRREGLEPVAVIVAQWFDRRTGIDEFLARLRDEAEVREVVIVGTGEHEAKNPPRSALDALTTGLLDRYGIKRIGVAAYPGLDHPSASRQPGESVAEYNAWATSTDAEVYFVTAPGTDVDVLAEWERSARRSGNLLPVRAGLTGPSAAGSLGSLERMCGIRPSHRDTDVYGGASFVRLALTAPYRTLRALARHKRAEPGCLFQAPHFITPDPLHDTALWLDVLLRGAFTLGEEQGRFVVRHAVSQ